MKTAKPNLGAFDYIILSNKYFDDSVSNYCAVVKSFICSLGPFCMSKVWLEDQISCRAENQLANER